MIEGCCSRCQCDNERSCSFISGVAATKSAMKNLPALTEKDGNRAVIKINNHQALLLQIVSFTFQSMPT